MTLSSIPRSCRSAQNPTKIAAKTATRSCHVAQVRLPLMWSSPGQASVTVAGSRSTGIEERFEFPCGGGKERCLNVAGNSISVKTVSSVFGLDAADVPTACGLGHIDL